jgi:dethiobiotin synthetase
MTATARLPVSGLFVAGTDTGVGKTTIGVGLARLARRRGRRPIPYKPVETGCIPTPEDALRLWQAAEPPTTLAETCPFPLPLPAAPAAAAAEVGIQLDLGDLVRRGRALSRRGDFLLAEGAGGLLAPYVDTTTNADLAAGLGLPILLVGRTALGTINHVALTLAELRRRDLPILGLVLVRTNEAIGPHEASNGALIEALTGLRPLGTIPFLSPTALREPEAVADVIERALPAPALHALLGSASSA